jgi:hypothetical protein
MVVNLLHTTRRGGGKWLTEKNVHDQNRWRDGKHAGKCIPSEEYVTETPWNVTSLLLDWNGGNRAALDALLPLVYRELRQMARRYMLSEARGHTLEPTALVHESCLRLIDQSRVNWQNRAQFFGVAAQIIRRLLIDHARGRHRLKRGGADLRVTWTEDINVPEQVCPASIPMNSENPAARLVPARSLDPTRSKRH